jgi:hypothetical protein
MDGKYTVSKAARRLGLSERWVKQLKKAVRLFFDGAVIQGNTRKYRANDTDESLRHRIIALKQNDLYLKRLTLPIFGNSLCNEKPSPSVIYHPLKPPQRSVG